MISVPAPVTERTSRAHSRMVHSSGFADVDGEMLFGARETDDAVDEIGDVAEAAGLGAVAVDGEGLAFEGLDEEVGDDAAVVGLETGAIGVEDADKVGVDAVVAVIGHDGSLGETLGFIVDGAQADGIDVAPVGFDLWVDFGVAVALGCRGVEVAGVVFAGEVEGVESAGGTDEESLGAEAGVVCGAGGRGEVEDEVYFAGVEWAGDVVLEEAEAALAFEMPEIGEFACAEVVDPDDRVPCSEQCVTKMGAEKSSGSCDENVSRDH